MIEPKEIQVEGKKFIISKFPAVAGREIMAKYLSSSTPKLGDYALNEETMFKLLCYVQAVTPAGNVALTTQALIDNHVGPWENLVKLEGLTIQYNCSFFQNGRISTLLDDLGQKLPAWGSKMLTGLLDQLSQKEKQPSTN